MTSRRKFSQSLALLFILLLGAAIAVPPGLHLEFCFGEGSHFDISLDTCHDLPSSTLLAQGECAFEHEHHGECRDLAVACDPFAEFLGPDRDVSLFRTKVNSNTPSATAFLAGVFFPPQPAAWDRFSFRPTRPTFLSFPLLSLRTVVLLI